MAGAAGGRKIGDAYVNVKADTSGMAPQVQKDAEKAGDDAGKGFGSHFVKALAVVGVAITGLVVAAAVQIKQSVDLASDLNETVSKTQVIFGDASGAVVDFAKKAATAMGQSEQTALDGAGAFAIYGKSAGLTGNRLVEFSTKLTQLASDVGSFSNYDPSQVIDDFGAALRGEFDPVEKYGILLNDAVVRQEALKLGIVKTTKDALTPQQRVLAVQSLLFKQTTLAQGDFARTSGGLANQQRIVAAQMQNLRTEIGSAFIPAWISVAQTLSGRVLPQLQKLWAVHGPQVAAIVERMAAKFDKWAASVNWDQVSAKIGAFFATLRGGIPTTDQVTGKASQLGAKIKDLWEQIQKGTSGGGEYSKTLDSLKDSTEVFGVIVGFAADHLHLLADALPFIAAAMAVNKAAQIAENIAAAAHPFIMIAQIAATRQLAAANRALAASRVENAAAAQAETAAEVETTAAKSTGLIATIRSTAAEIGARIAKIAGAVATGIATAAQWLWNVALTANPIGLIIVAIGLLVIAFVYLWNHSEGFRNFFIGMWQDIWGLMKTIGAWFAGPFADFFVNLWNRIVDSGKAVYNFFVHTLPDGFRSAYNWISGIMSSIRNAIVERFQNAVAFVAGLPGQIYGYFSGLGSRLLEVGRSIVEGIGNGIRNAAGWLYDKARDLAQGALDAAKHAIGFGSPAKKFMPLGESMGTGTIVGLKRILPDVRKAAADMVAPPSASDSLLALAASGQGGGGNRTTNNNVNVYAARAHTIAELVAAVKRELAWEAGL